MYSVIKVHIFITILLRQQILGACHQSVQLAVIISILSVPLEMSESVKEKTEQEMKRILDLSNTEVVQPVDLSKIEVRYHIK